MTTRPEGFKPFCSMAPPVRTCASAGEKGAPLGYVAGAGASTRRALKPMRSS